MNYYFFSSHFIFPLINFFITVGIIFLVLKYFLPVINGAPFLPTSQVRVKKMLELLDLKPGQKLIDLGAGDGRIITEAASRGIDAIGYEINPLLVLWGRWKIKKLGLNSQAEIFWKNFWSIDLSQADAITVFGATAIMPKLEKKFLTELKPGAKICSYVFPLPNSQPLRHEEGIYLYQK
jgi:precorrin-6B methylase 2